VSSIVHIDGHKSRIPNSWTWPGVVLLSIAFMIWAWLLKPLFWWFFRSGYLSTVSDDMLVQDRILDPVRERWHVFWAAVLFIATCIFAYLAYQWHLNFLLLAFLAGTSYLACTAAYNSNTEENKLYDPWG
jgi:hypothetical protein